MPNRSTSPSTSACIQLVADVWCSTLKSQLDLELRGGRTIAGVTARSALRLLAVTAAIWHNRNTSQPVTQSLTACDH